MQLIVHEHPVGRAATNYIARADLAPFGLDGQAEQLWLKAVNDGSYEVACIPFSTYGIALGDTVLLNDDDYVSEVVGTSQHRTLRLLFTPDLPASDLQLAAGRIKTEITAAGLLSEWNGERFVAVDVPPNAEPSELFAVMEAAVNAGHAFWEWANAMPFASSS
ncbi:DUF4265 domain-containing protein [Kitasatospora sp. NBC_01246]|uniref:DUF4265 domain-containing protein n=1 Tax=Kitasatospora sp. NBC_01246 TaxID=2903570 RepID=UPI002E36C030|nr:DUF4265 domain-containing protein [Kitasatospora sp. NBC_01246]